MTTPVQESVFESNKEFKLPKPFILRRLHSLLGLWLVIYLSEHLFVNSQSALFFYDDGYGFISAVNKLEALPYLKVIEIVFLGVPFFLHGLWGIYYAWTAKLNAHHTDGAKPALSQYKRNRGYSWQRITSWLLVIGIIAHVIHMRFIIYPTHYAQGDQQNFMIKVNNDKSLASVAEKLDVKLYNAREIHEIQNSLEQEINELMNLKKDQPINDYNKLIEQVTNKRNWIKAAKEKKLKQEEVLAVSPNAGAAFFLLVRETFKSPLLVVLYSFFVIAACYHAFNGIWTFMIKWGITLTCRSQKRMRTIANFFMCIVTLLGLIAAWGTYWTIQFQSYTHRE